MDVLSMLNEEPSPGPGRSRGSVSQARSDVRRSLSNVHDLSSPTSQHMQSPVNNFRSLPDEVVSRSASTTSPAKPSPKVLSTRRADSPQANVTPVAAPNNQQSEPAGNNKRSAPSELDSAIPAKRSKHRRHTERPIWARLSPRNSRYVPGNGTALTAAPTSAPTTVRSVAGVRASNGVAQPDSRPSAQEGLAAEINWSKPWLNSIPYDFDLLRARRSLGPWEKSMKYSTPYPDLLFQLSTWILETLKMHKAVVQDASQATFEIEAKIGTLVKAQSGQPIDLPVLNMTLLSPSVQRDYRFESELQEADFVYLNQMLNATLLESRQPGREAMQHTRRNERDSFAGLSPAGIDGMPAELRTTALHGRELKLRTTYVDSTGETTARIVKVPLSHRQIYNPHGYDCRISINVEVNFMQRDAQDMVVAPTIERPAPPDRKKERLSYTHLGAYSVDLTKVQAGDLAPKYELEVEVQSSILLKQIEQMTARQPDAFSDVVSGFWDNAQFLMRQRGT